MSNLTRAGLGVAVIAVATACFAAAPAPRKIVSAYESSARPVAQGPVDEAVFTKLSQLGVEPVLCSDAVFVRRAFLDVIGTLPTAKEAREFIQDPDTKNKRRHLIDRLLARDEFADYWAMKWGDIFRIKAEFPVNLWPNAAQAYHRWVRASLAENKPYDRFARELLTASGSNFRVGQANFYRAVQNRTPESIATTVALTFMGTRAELWPEQQLKGMGVFFSQIGYKPTSEWKEEHVFWDPLGISTAAGNTAAGRPAVSQVAQAASGAAKLAAVTPVDAKPMTAVFPDGTEIQLPPNRDPRDVFADWLISPTNPWFTRNIANRVWSWLVGRGIIHEPDDIRPDNPPGNPALLAVLEQELVANRYDLKHLYRIILNSQSYQLSSLPRHPDPKAEANFASYPLRRLDAEVLIDAINQITGTTDLYTSPIPEPFTYIPEKMRAVAIADGSITSSFLALFGRSARATGLENERDNKAMPAQWLHLLNSSHIQRKLEGPKLKAIFESGRPAPAIVEELYLAILSRLPTPEEAKLAASHLQLQAPSPAPAATKSGKNVPVQKVSTAKTARPVPPTKAQQQKRREDWIDLAWALMNSSEFLYRH